MLIARDGMRTVISFLINVAILLAQSNAIPDVSGIWSLDRSRSNVEFTDFPKRITIAITQTGEHLKVVEVNADRSGEKLNVCDYSLAQRAMESEGRKQAGLVGWPILVRSTRPDHNQMSDVVEEWTLSLGGNQLTIVRQVDTSGGKTRQTLVFKRSIETLESASSAGNK